MQILQLRKFCNCTIYVTRTTSELFYVMLSYSFLALVIIIEEIHLEIGFIEEMRTT